MGSQGFRWIRHDDVDHSVLAFERRARDGSRVVVLSHFTPEVRPSYRLGLPVAGRWREIINTDSQVYGGSGVSGGEVQTEPVPCDGHPQSAVLTLPPLATRSAIVAMSVPIAMLIPRRGRRWSANPLSRTPPDAVRDPARDPRPGPETAAAPGARALRTRTGHYP